MMKTDTLVVEFDGPMNQQAFFQPLGRAVRGRFDSRRIRNGGRLYQDWPEEIPSQRLELNATTGEAFVVEPLHDAQYAALREQITGKGWKLAPYREAVLADVATWQYWLKGLVDSGTARIVAGSLPEKITGKPKLRFLSAETVDPVDRLASAIEAQTAAIEKLLSRMADK